jgi:hypothetical protein
MNRCGRGLIRWDKKADNYLGFLHFACALIAFRGYPEIPWHRCVDFKQPCGNEIQGGGMERGDSASEQCC